MLLPFGWPNVRVAGTISDRISDKAQIRSVAPVQPAFVAPVQASVVPAQAVPDEKSKSSEIAATEAQIAELEAEAAALKAKLAAEESA